jgi:hypothetical protein
MINIILVIVIGACFGINIGFGFSMPEAKNGRYILEKMAILFCIGCVATSVLLYRLDLL